MFLIHSCKYACPLHKYLWDMHNIPQKHSFRSANIPQSYLPCGCKKHDKLLSRNIVSLIQIFRHTYLFRRRHFSYNFILPTSSNIKSCISSEMLTAFQTLAFFINFHPVSSPRIEHASKLFVSAYFPYFNCCIHPVAYQIYHYNNN